jgi:thymidylate synthase
LTDKEGGFFMRVYTGSNPGQLYFNALIEVMRDGDELAPRGKKIRELRPAAFEYTNPLNRVVFLKGRKMNPFFLLAEALWILGGRSDVEWLTRYNKSIAEFSDDGVHFNAPYGERLRFWNANDYRGFIFNPIDQLADVYKKFQKDIHTRQAVALIYNPLFDNASYEGKDTPCNNVIFFKVRNNKLEMTVCNRSNDLHYGVFTNLVQFSTIQEVIAAWLGIEVGTYTQFTDSLHVYLEDYGAKETDKILTAYGINQEYIHTPNYARCDVKQFTFENEPRISLGFDDFQEFIAAYFSHLDNYANDDEYMSKPHHAASMVHSACQAPDEYFKTTLLAMFAYRGHRLGNVEMLLECLRAMPDCQWKVSCLYFLYSSYKDNEQYNALFAEYPEDIQAYIKGV